MSQTLSRAFWQNFLGHSPQWYNVAVVAFLLINPVIYAIAPIAAGWLLIGEFIFCLAMALKCYPLQPGGLLAIEAVLLGMTSAASVMHEITHNLAVLLLLIFMVAGIYFMKDLLMLVFTRLLLGVRSKGGLSLCFCLTCAFLSAFLDALTVTAVLISIGVGFYGVYHQVASGAPQTHGHSELEQFRAFLRSLIMHGVVGTALGGVCTLVGEPQNLLIGHKLGWNFQQFFWAMSSVSLPALAAGLLCCLGLERFKIFGYGAQLPPAVRLILAEYNEQKVNQHHHKHRAALIVQGVVAILLILALALHMAEVGLIGLTVIILLTAFNGITDEHRLGEAFAEALPFTALLVVFFVVVAVIHDQQLFAPITQWVLVQDHAVQAPYLFIANGLLSSISDNVFVATVYINEIQAAFDRGAISRQHFEHLAIAVNTGTNLPSVATPNGQAAFLFLLTSALAPLIRLSYGTMVWMALPYTITLSVVGLACVTWAL